MVNKYLYISVLTSSLILAEGVDLPTAHQLKKIENDLHQACLEKKCLIQEADLNGHFERITTCLQQIRALEATPGRTDMHNRQSGLIKALCSNGKHTESCTLLEEFQACEQQRLNTCTTGKCETMRLYNQLNSHTKEIAEQLSPEHKKKLQALNNKIASTCVTLNAMTGKDYKETFTDCAHMLLL